MGEASPVRSAPSDESVAARAGRRAVGQPRRKALQTKEILCKSLITPSGLADYCINPYVGCEHGCRYCYARYMKRFTGHAEPWGEFVDVRINAPEVIEREVHRKPRGLSRAKPRGRVFIGSVCDAWQPLEERYRITRECVKILAESGWPFCILTKNALVQRDLDIVRGAGADIGVTVTASDESIREKIEPRASPTLQRIEVLREAGRLGISIWVFLGPFIPGLTDTEENLDSLMSQISDLPITHFYVDRLNFRSGVASSLRGVIGQHFPQILPTFEEVTYDPQADRAYQQRLGRLARKLARRHGIENKMKCGF
jgi:DNA repair photolyase